MCDSPFFFFNLTREFNLGTRRKSGWLGIKQKPHLPVRKISSFCRDATVPSGTRERGGADVTSPRRGAPFERAEGEPPEGGGVSAAPPSIAQSEEIGASRECDFPFRGLCNVSRQLRPEGRRLPNAQTAESSFVPDKISAVLDFFSYFSWAIFWFFY